MLALVALVYFTSCSNDNETTPTLQSNEKAMDKQKNSNVGNSNLAPTVEAHKFEIAEDAIPNDLIGIVEGKDPEGNSLTYTIIEDNSELFQVSDDGKITLANGKNLDFETTSSYMLTLNISDGTNDPVEFKVKIRVVNVIENLFEDPKSLILKFQVTAGQALVIGTSADYEYDYTIDWGDDSEEEILTVQNPTHEYTEDGTYTVAINGTFPALVMGITDFGSQNALVDVVQWGTQKWQSMENVFGGCGNLSSFSAVDQPDLSQTTSMAQMFQFASTFNGDIGKWDVSSVTNMSNFLLGAASFNQSLADWNISSVTNMSGMLNNTGMTAESLNSTLIGWNANVTTNEGPNDIVLSVDGLTVCGQEVLDAIENLGNNHMWTLNGDFTIENNCQ